MFGAQGTEGGHGAIPTPTGTAAAGGHEAGAGGFGTAVVPGAGGHGGGHGEEGTGAAGATAGTEGTRGGFPGFPGGSGGGTGGFPGAGGGFPTGGEGGQGGFPGAGGGQGGQGGFPGGQFGVPFDINTAMYFRNIHGILCSLAMVILFPLGSILMRIVPGRFAIWAHAGFQMIAICIYIAGAALGIYVVTIVQIPFGGGNLVSLTEEFLAQRYPMAL